MVELENQLVGWHQMDLKHLNRQLVGRCKVFVEFLAASHFYKVHYKLSDVEEGCIAMEKTTDHPVGKIGQQGHEFFGLDGASFCGRENLLGWSVAARRDAKAGWIQQDESKLLLRKALFSVERSKDESLRQYTTRRLAQIEAAEAAALVTMPTTTWGTVLKEGARLTKQSEKNLNTLLNGSTDLDDVARALNMLDLDTQEGIIKAAVKPVVHSHDSHGRSLSRTVPSAVEQTSSNLGRRFLGVWGLYRCSGSRCGLRAPSCSSCQRRIAVNAITGGRLVAGLNFCSPLFQNWQHQPCDGNLDFVSKGPPQIFS